MTSAVCSKLTHRPAVSYCAMMKLTIFLLIAALAYTSAKAVDDSDDKLDSPPDASDLSDGDAFRKFKVPSADDIKNLSPRYPGEHVKGHFQSESSFKKIINGKVVDDKKDSETADRNDDVYRETKSSTN